MNKTNWERWRSKFFLNSTSFSNSHNGFVVSWRPCLNFCSLKWLQPSNKTCNKTNSSKIMIIINRVWRWSYELQNFVLKAEKRSDFLKWESKLFYSVLVYGKSFWKRSFLCLEGGCYVYFESSITSACSEPTRISKMELKIVNYLHKIAPS